MDKLQVVNSMFHLTRSFSQHFTITVHGVMTIGFIERERERERATLDEWQEMLNL